MVALGLYKIDQRKGRTHVLGQGHRMYLVGKAQGTPAQAVEKDLEECIEGALLQCPWTQRL